MILWIILAIVVGVCASNRGRSGFLWGLLSFIISPVIAGIILAISKDLSVDSRSYDVERKVDNIKTEVDFNQKFNDHRSEQMEKRIDRLSDVVGEKEFINSGKKYDQISEGNKINCMKCGKSISEDSKFCPECGGQIEKYIECPFCHSHVDIGVKYCPDCGQNVSFLTMKK